MIAWHFILHHAFVSLPSRSDKVKSTQWMNDTREVGGVWVGFEFGLGLSLGWGVG